jgi:hypothetical protein
MNEKFKIHLQGTADTRQWAAANGILGKLEGSADRFVDTLRAGVGIDLGGRLVSGLASLPGIFADTLKAGFDFNVSLHDSEIAISNVVQKFMGLNAEAGKNEAAKAMAQIIELEPKAAGTLQDLTSGFIASLAAAQAAGVSIEENIELVGLFANGLANAAIPAEQLVQEMRAVFSGNLGPDAAFGAGVLGLKNEDIRKAKEAGNLYQLLKERIGTLGVAGDSASVAMSSLGSAISKAQGILAKPLFEKAVQGAKDLTVALDNPEVIKALTDLGIGIGKIVDTGTGLASWAVQNAEGIKQLVYWIHEGMKSVTGLGGAMAMLGLLSDTAPKAPQPTAPTPAPTPTAPATPTASPATAIDASTSGTSTATATAKKETDDLKTSLEKARAATGDQAAELRVLQVEYEKLVKTLDEASPAALKGLSGENLIKAIESDSQSGKWSTELLETLKEAAAKATEIKTLKEQIDQQAIQENERLRKAAADTARANAEVKADEAKVALALDAEKAEIAITAAKAAGQDAVAKQLEDQQRINELARGYREDLKLSDSEAQALAEQRVTSERQLSDRNEADSGGGGGSDLDRLIERAKESERRRKDRFKYSIANPGQEVSSIDQIKNNTIFEGGFYNNRGGGKATASRPDSSLTTGGPLTEGGGLAGLREMQKNRFSNSSRLSDSSPLTPGGGLADFKANSGAVNTAGKGGADAVNLGPNGAASQAKGAADAMARLGTQITARDAATAAELSRLKGLVSELERRIAQNAQITANNRT